MEKNRSLRTASGLFVLVLLTICVVGATYAKYVTSDTATDTARVAKWGVTVSATGNLFGAEYDMKDSTTNGDQIAASTSSNINVDSGDSEKVVAPGTKNDTGLALTITGTPEVAVKVETKATLTLTGWEIPSSSGSGTEEYCPIVFTIDGNDYKIGTNGNDANHVYTSVSNLKTAVETALNKTENSVNPNTNLGNAYNHTVKWRWDFAGASDSYQTDEKDTALGDLTTAPEIRLDYTATVTQID